jgi:hypothetical protein
LLFFKGHVYSPLADDCCRPGCRQEIAQWTIGPFSRGFEAVGRLPCRCCAGNFDRQRGRDAVGLESNPTTGGDRPDPRHQSHTINHRPSTGSSPFMRPSAARTTSEGKIRASVRCALTAGSHGLCVPLSSLGANQTAGSSYADSTGVSVASRNDTRLGNWTRDQTSGMNAQRQGRKLSAYLRRFGWACL